MKKIIKIVLISIVAIIVLSVIFGRGSEQKPQTTPVTTQQTQGSSPKETLESTANAVVKDGSLIVDEENGEWVIVKQVEIKESFDFAMFIDSKEMARNFIFALYATKLPIKHIAITINNYSTGKYYRAGLGKDIASTQPESTWTDKNIGPTIFYDFLKDHKNGTSSDGKYSTYVETNFE